VGVNCGSLDAWIAARVWGRDAAIAAANHLRAPAATCLGAEVGQATGAGMNHGSLDVVGGARVWGGDSAIAAANHSRAPAATCLGAKVV
jgi:hypothetical protein